MVGRVELGHLTPRACDQPLQRAQVWRRIDGQHRERHTRLRAPDARPIPRLKLSCRELRRADLAGAPNRLRPAHQPARRPALRHATPRNFTPRQAIAPPHRCLYRIAPAGLQAEPSPSTPTLTLRFAIRTRTDRAGTVLPLARHHARGPARSEPPPEIAARYKPAATSRCPRPRGMPAWPTSGLRWSSRHSKAHAILTRCLHDSHAMLTPAMLTRCSRDSQVFRPAWQHARQYLRDLPVWCMRGSTVKVRRAVLWSSRCKGTWEHPARPRPMATAFAQLSAGYAIGLRSVCDWSAIGLRLVCDWSARPVRVGGPLTRLSTA